MTCLCCCSAVLLLTRMKGAYTPCTLYGKLLQRKYTIRYYWCMKFYNLTPRMAVYVIPRMGGNNHVPFLKHVVLIYHITHNIRKSGLVYINSYRASYLYFTYIMLNVV